MEENIITSAQNPKIKRLQLLQQKSSERRKSGLFVVEGRRELQHCINAGFEVDTAFVCRDLLEEGYEAPAKKVFEVSSDIYEKIAYRGSTEGIVAEVIARQRTLDDLSLGESPLVVVLESVEKPGNLGAVLRSADAAGADAVIVCEGAIFTVPCVACSSDECIAFLKQRGISILTAQLQDSSLYYDIDMRRPTAIVMGTESTGLTNQWRQAADAHIRIPMLGRLDSLNVSVSAAILLFEAVRQRQ